MAVAQAVAKAGWPLAVSIAVIVSSCSVPVPSPSPSPPSEPASSSPSALPSTPPTSGPPGLNRLERKVAKAMGELGLDAMQVEYQLNGAFMWAQVGNDAEVFVSAYPTDIEGHDFTVLDERRLAGLTVQRIEYESGDTRNRFVCHSVAYQAFGAPPPRFATFDEFVEALIPSLGCGAG